MTDFRGEVRLALTNFLDDPQTEATRLRHLAETAWEAVCAEAGTLVESGEDSAASRFLLLLFAERGHLVPYLAHLLERRREIARRTVRLAARVDAELERSLARSVLESKRVEQGSPAQTALLELLQMLAEDAAEGGNPERERGGEAEEPRVRSRVAELVGRAARVQSCYRTICEEPDPRVRADTIESLWAQGGALAAACFERAAQDENHRVALNALVGLYRAGEARSVGLLAKAIEHPDRAFRAAAAWAMGESCDSRFVPLLWKLRRSEDRSMAALATRSCEKVLLAQAEAEREPAALHSLGVWQRGAGVEARCVVLDAQRSFVELRATDWRLKLGGRPVWGFSARQVEGLPRYGLAAVLPAAGGGRDGRADIFAAALREGFRAKRGQDVLAVAHYADGDGAPESRPAGPAQTRPSALSPDLRLAVRIAASPPAGQLEAGPLAAASSAVRAFHQFKGARHVVVVADRLAEGQFDEDCTRELTSLAARSGVVCHAVYTAGLPGELGLRLSWLAAETGGFTLSLDSLDSLTAALALLSGAINRHYEIRLEGEPEGDRLDVEIAGQHHAGRAHWALIRPRGRRQEAADLHWERESSPAPVKAGPGSGDVLARAGNTAVL